MKQLSTLTTFDDGMISDFTYITYNDYRDGERLLTHSTVNYRDLKNELNRNRIADFTAGDLLAAVTIAPFVTTESWQDTYTVILDQGYGPIANIYNDSFEKIELNNLEEDEGFRLQFLYQHLDDVGVFQEIYEELEGKGSTSDEYAYFVPLEKDKHGNWTKQALLRASSFDPDETITSQNILENADYIEYREIYYQEAKKSH